MTGPVRWGVAAATALFCMVYLPLFHYTAVHEVGIMHNRISGVVSVDTPGFHLTPPWVFVAKVDTRPQRVCIESVARVVTCRLAMFNRAAYQEFVAREGFRYYWWDNRFSVNFGHDNEYRGTRNIVRAYAFSNASQSFVYTLKEFNE
jgi:hypothetical protein